MPDSPVTLYAAPGRRIRKLHRYPDCIRTASREITGVVRVSECSGAYAVQPDPPFFVLGDVCPYCQARYRAATQ